ncbi:hypothetical protein FRAHR75_820001 [Frankia sp. Hr75.2]|nr:hypothetical protein FRAHR75_820001 [Frankia sp. Hr75.2]
MPRHRRRVGPSARELRQAASVAWREEDVEPRNHELPVVLALPHASAGTTWLASSDGVSRPARPPRACGDDPVPA